MAQAQLDALQDIKVEAAIIGTLFTHPEYLEEYDGLQPEYFYGQEGYCLFWAIKRLVERGATEIDAVKLTMAIAENKRISGLMKDCSLPAFDDLIDTYQLCGRNNMDEFDSLVHKLLDLAYRREMIKSLNTIIPKIYDLNLDLDRLENEIYDSFDKIADSFIQTDDVKPIGDSIDEIYESILADQNGDGSAGIKSKYEAFNDYFSYEVGELVVVEARLKKGKSALLMNEAVHKALQGIPTLVVDTEMTDKNYVMRLLSHLAGVPVSSVKNGANTVAEEQAIQKAKMLIKDLPLIHLYHPEINMSKLYAECKRLKRTWGLEFVVFDYIKCDEDDSYNALGKMTDFLKNRIAGELEMAVLSACQLNRQGQVADSDKIERYMSTAILWDSKSSAEIDRDTPNCGNFKATITVNRNGKAMDDPQQEYIDFSFRGDYMMIDQADDHRKYTVM